MIQNVKCQIMPFNPCWIPHDLDEIDLSASSTQGAVNNASGYAAGSTTITVDGLTTTPPTGTVVRFEGHDWAYKISTSTSTSLVLLNGLEKRVEDNEAFYFEPVIDVSDDLLAVSDWEFKPEVTRNEFTLDNQMDFVFVNAGNKFYDRLQYLAEWLEGYQYVLSNFDIEGDRTPKYIRIALRDSTTWSTFYVGKFVDGETSVNYPDNNVSVMTESVLYALRDQLMMDVDGVYNNLKYTDADNLTRTIVGPLKTIIAKTFYKAGIKSSNVSFDSDGYFAYERHYGWLYHFGDVWFNTPIWKQNAVDSSPVLSWLESIMKRFLASAVLHFEGNTPYVYFRSKRNRDVHRDILYEDDFVAQSEKDKVKIESWRHYAENGVFAKSVYEYFNGATLESGFHYDGTGFHHVTGFPVENQSGVEGSRSINATVDEGDDIEIVGGSRYRIRNYESTDLWIVPGRYAVTPDVQADIREFTPFALNNKASVDLEFSECLKFKMTHPDIFVSCAENSFIQLSNIAGTDITGYRPVGRFYGVGSGSNTNAVSVVDLVPVSWHHQTGTRCAFYTDRVDTDDEQLMFSTLDIPSTEEFGTTNLWLNDSLYTFGDNLNTRHMSSGFIKKRNEENDEVATRLVVCVAKTTSGIERIYRFLIDMDTTAGPIVDYFGSVSSPFSDDDLIEYTGVTLKSNDGDNPKVIELTGQTTDVTSVFVNSDVMNPWADDRMYYPYLGVKKRDLFGQRISFVGNVFTSSANIYGLHVHPSEDATNGQHYFITDTDGLLVYRGYGASFSNFEIIAGGGANPIPALYDHDTATDVGFTNPVSVWKMYDNKVVVCDRDEEKVCIVDLDGNTLYTLTDSTITSTPNQVCAEDFMSAWIIEASPASGNTWDFYVNFDYLASKLMFDYYGTRRRVIKGRVRSRSFSARPKMYDIVRVDGGAIRGEGFGPTDCWIIGMTYNFDRQEYFLELLEV